MKTNWWINQRLLLHWSPFVSPTSLHRQHWLDKKCARKHLNPYVPYMGYFLWNVCLILIFTSKDSEAFHTTHQNQHHSSRISQRYAVPSSVWLEETLELTFLPCNGTNVVFTDSWACEYWPCEGILSSAERRCGTSQLRPLMDETLNTTWQRAVSPMEPNLPTYSCPATISLRSALCVILHWRSCTVGMCPWQCAVSGKVEKQKLSVLLPSGCRC